MRHKILKKMLSILILFIILSQSLIPIILANNQVEEKIENSINENETTLENLIEEDNNNATNNIIDNEILNNEIVENVNNNENEENIEEKEIIENNIDITNEDMKEEIIDSEEDIPNILSARSAGGVATTNNITYFDSEYRLVF